MSKQPRVSAYPTVSHPKPHPDCDYCKAAKHALDTGADLQRAAVKKVRDLDAALRRLIEEAEITYLTLLDEGVEHRHLGDAIERARNQPK